MNCQKIRNLLPAYIDKVLDKRKAFSIQRHLEVCLRCRQEEKRLKETLIALKKWEVPDPGSQFWFFLPKKVVSQISDLNIEKSFKDILSSWLRFPIPIAIELGIFISLLILFMCLLPHSRIENDSRYPCVSSTILQSNNIVIVKQPAQDIERMFEFSHDPYTMLERMDQKDSEETPNNTFPYIILTSSSSR